MSRRGEAGLGLLSLCAIAAACGNPDQLYRHRDAGTTPPTVTGGGGAFGGGAGTNVTGTGGVLGGTGGANGGASGSIGGGGAIGSGGASGSNGGGGSIGGGGTAGGASGASGSGGSPGNDASTDASGSGASGDASGNDASADASIACTSMADCHCDSYGGHAYKFCGNGRGYVDAAAACASQGMRLIRIDDEAENQWAFSGKGARGFPSVWIGADDMTVEGNWRWSDGTPFWTGKAGAAGAGPVGGLFNAWQTSPPQPDQNGDEDCAGYDYSNDRWADLPCTNHNAYICEAY